MLFKYYRSYSTFRNIFNTMAISLILSIFVLSILLTAIFSSISINQTNEISTRMLSRLELMTERVYDEAYSVLLSLGFGEDIDINTMMFGDTRNRLRDYSGSTRMRLLQSIYQDISYIGVYNGKIDELMCTIGLEKETENKIRQSILDHYTSTGSRILIPMNNQKIVVQGYDPNLNTLTLIYYSPLSTNSQIGAIFLAIDCSYLSDFTTSINDENAQLTFIVDANGIVLSHPDETQILSDYSSIDYVKSSILKDKPSDSFFIKNQNKQTLVTYIHGDLNWYYITLTPYTNIMKKIRSILLFTAGSSLLIIIISAIFSLYAAQKSFNPIAILLTKLGYNKTQMGEKGENEIQYLDDQINYLKETSGSNDSLLLVMSFESLLKGDLNDEIVEILHKNIELIKASFYVVSIMQIKKTAVYRDLSRRDKNLSLISLSKLVKECIDPISLGTYSVTMSSSTIAVIIKLDQGVLPEGLVLALLEVNKIFTGNLNLEFSTSVSGIYEDLYALQDAYEEAIVYMNEQFFENEASFLLMNKRQTSFINYNTRLENEIWQAIQENNDIHIKEFIAQFMSELTCVTPQYARLYINQLAISIISHSISFLPDLEVEPFNICKWNLGGLDSMKQAEDELVRLCCRVASLNTSQHETNTPSIIHEAISLVKVRYTDPSFSINDAADSQGLTIVYFNRIFKKNTGQSFSAYLNTFRLSIASNYIRTTDLSMSKICNKVGISNESYFYTLFKKEYGITPHQFRDKCEK